jgi:CubicO group peptidase (beta-lactamase class C family)
MIAASDPIDRALTDAIARGGVPGVAAAVVADGRVQEALAAGVADAGTGDRVTSGTAFLWFSMTKIVTATAAMRLVDHGRLALDDDVERLVPGILPSRRSAAVRVRHLLQHSTGLPNPPPIRWVRPANHPAPDPDAFLRQRFAHVRKLRFEPGTRAAYTNLGYLLLGAVIAAASGRPFTDYVHDEILAPLAMHATSFAMPSDAGAAATGHQRLPRGFGPLLAMAFPSGIVGSRSERWMRFQPFLVEGAAYGGLVGPVTDAARLVLMHANRGYLDGARVLSESSVREMQTISIAGRPFDYGLGWSRRHADRDHQPPFVEHYGGGGYYNLMRLYPDNNVGVVVMGNSTSYDIDTLTNAITRPWLE